MICRASESKYYSITLRCGVKRIGGSPRFLRCSKRISCHVDNVCEGILLAAQKGRAGAIYFLTDGPPVRSRDFLTALLATQGVTPGDRSVPFVLARLGASVVGGIWRLLGVKAPPPLQRTSVLLIGQQVTVRDARARSELGCRAHKSREEGLRELSSSA